MHQNQHLVIKYIRRNVKTKNYNRKTEQFKQKLRGTKKITYTLYIYMLNCVGFYFKDPLSHTAIKIDIYLYSKHDFGY